jgi:hypothetical protein
MFLPQKTPKLFECKKCDFITSNIKDYNRHLATRKHENTTKYNAFTPKNPTLFPCECGKTYPYRSSLYNHKKNCKFRKNIPENIDYKKMFISMIKENKELCTIMTKQNELNDKLITTNTNINNQIIGNNNTINKHKLNINIFLNEQCKDALTMNEFIDKIKITLDNLLITKNKGLTEGVSNIFIENMNKLSLYQRPIHCTDVKRETVYIKYNVENKGSNWQQDNENIQLKESLKKISQFQQKNLNKWTEEHPTWMENPELQQEYMKLIKNCTDDLQENKREEKVIKKLCNKVYLGDTEKFNLASKHQPN